MEPVYYNEIEPYAVQWLRNLIDAGHIAHGIVDDRSIVDVTPSDLAGFRQCHFFAGVGVWSYALRRAGVPDDADVWTGSCPCQPFSAAGAGAGMDDQRHLWPHFQHLIRARRPTLVLGEQVASKDADPWIDLVQDDMEAMEYGVWSCPFPSAGIGAPHIRDRLYWVADAHGSAGRQGSANLRGRIAGGDAQPWAGLGGSGLPDGLAYTELQQRPEREPGVGHVDDKAGRLQGPAALAGFRGDCRMADAAGIGLRGQAREFGGLRVAERCEVGQAGSASPTNGLWADADWLFCRDGKWRPVEPGTFPLAHGAPARVGRLRTYGNAINAEAARVFIESVMC